MAASEGARALSHAISFGVTLAVLTNICQYIAWKTKGRKGSHWQRFGPLYICMLSVPLVMADLTRHLLQDSGVWASPGSSMYRPGCHVPGPIKFRCLSLVGWLFTVLFTYSGFLCLIISTLWSARVGTKVRTAWRSIRSEPNL